MIRLCGILCLVCASAGTGFYRAHRLREDVRSLELLCGWTEDAAACIRHQQMELPELLAFLASHPNYRRFRFPGEVCRELSPLQPPGVLWERAVLADSAVPASARSILIGLGNTLGTTDCEGQIAALTLYRHQLTQALAAARETLGTKGKLCRSLGLLGGAMAAVILL